MNSDDKRGLLARQFARLAATPLLLLVLLAGSDRRRLAWLAALLVVLDFVDCIPLVHRGCGRSEWYRNGDKLLDLAQTAAGLCLVWSWPSMSTNRWALLLAWLARTVGVALFVDTRDPRWLAATPDVFKELLLLWSIAPRAGLAASAAVVAAKALFEVAKPVVEARTYAVSSISSARVPATGWPS